MSNDLISRSALIENFKSRLALCNEWIEKSKDKETKIRADATKFFICEVIMTIDNAPTVERPQGEWIPVSERRFPDDETEVLIQYGESMMVGYHIFDRTIYPFGYEDENETGWYDSKDNFICGSDEVIAWMPLPEPYEEAENV